MILKVGNKKREQMTRGIMIIIIINIFIYLVLNFFPQSKEYVLLIRNYKTAMLRPWTIISVFFSHENMVHLLFNMFILWVFGTRLEKATNLKTTLLVYFLSGIAGSLLCLMTNIFFIDLNEYMVGASAAVFGIVGMYTYLQPNVIIFGSKTKTWMVVLFIVTVLLGFNDNKTIDSSIAHLAGMIVGILMGVVYRYKYILNNKK